MSFKKSCKFTGRDLKRFLLFLFHKSKYVTRTKHTDKSESATQPN